MFAIATDTSALNSLAGPVSALIITVLCGVIVYLFTGWKKEIKYRLLDKDKYADKLLELADLQRQQQELWFEKIQLARGR